MALDPVQYRNPSFLQEPPREVQKAPKKYIFYIDSDLRLSPETSTSSSFSYILYLPQDATHVSVMQATIPKSYYLVQSGNNTFTLKHGVTTYVITIPIGNYSMRKFKATLTSLLNAASAFVYTVTYPGMSDDSAETGKFVYTVTGNAGVQPQFIFPSTSTLYRQMGFEEASTNTFVADTLTSTNVLDFDLVSAIYILSDICEAGVNQQQSSSVLQEIFAQNTVTYARIGFLNPCPELTAKPLMKDRTVFTFSICDNDSRPLNLNGLQINLSLLVF